MKLIRVFSFILIFLLIMSSCSRSYVDVRALGESIERTLGDDVRLYYSFAKEADDEYLSPDIRKELFANVEKFSDNYALILTTRWGEILEIGIILADSRSEAIDISEICMKRIGEIGEWTDAHGRVTVKNNLVIYYAQDSDVDLDALIESVL